MSKVPAVDKQSGTTVWGVACCYQGPADPDNYDDGIKETIIWG